MLKIKNRIAEYITSISIFVKIYGMFFAVIFLITALSIVVVRFSTSETLSYQLDERVKSIGSDVAARSADLMLTNNIYAMQKLVYDTVAHYKDIEYVFILDENGKVIVHTYGNDRPSMELIHINTVDSLVDNHLVMIETEKGFIRDVAVPIVKGLGGTVRVGLRSDFLDEALISVTSKIILTMVIVLALLIFIVLFVTRVIVYPIKQLVELTKKASRGDFTHRIFTYPKDEIGKLTQSFNKMLSDLEKADVEKEEYYNQIISRNRELKLLNSISANITSVIELREVLLQFVTNLVNELSLNSAVIEVKLVDSLETFYYSGSNCPLDEFELITDERQRVCTCKDGTKKHLETL
uniref:histidine kinase n=1 Tax=Anaerobacillus isosaccharinicus TaxID=1532552 RepID=A0A1S2L4U3_9BACI